MTPSPLARTAAITRVEQRCRGEGAGGVVHEHDAHGRATTRRAGCDGLLPGVAARDDGDERLRPSGGRRQRALGRSSSTPAARRRRPARARRSRTRGSAHARASASPARCTKAFGMPAPRRVPLPAATTMTATSGCDSMRSGYRNADEGGAATAPPSSSRAVTRRRGPRRGRSTPSPRRSSRRARARRSGSGGPWRACASRRPRGRGPGRGATGRGRPRTP